VDDITFRGGAGDDSFESGRGNDTIIGGLGIDTGVYVFVQQGSGSGSHCNDITADLSSGVASGEGFGTDALRGVENLAGGAGEDQLTGDAHANTFYVGLPCANTPVEREFVAGGEGRDRIDFSTYWYSDGSLGPVIVDLAFGTARKVSPFTNPDVQTDALVALDSVENATGSRFKDTIVGDAGPNRLSGHDSRDLIRGGGGDDILSGSSGPDEIYGDEGDDELLGEDGNDRLDGGTGSNAVDGGKSRDTCQNPDRYNGALNCEA
jgi:Ca2+-binding RTX toxin-like protein